MKFRKFGKTVLTAALSSAIVISLSSCVRSFTVGYLYVTGTVTGPPTGNGIISGFKIDNNTGKLTAMHGLPVASGGANPVRIVLLSGGNFVYVLNQGAPQNGHPCDAAYPCTNPNITEFVVGGNGILTPQETFYTQGFNPMRLISDASGAHLMVLDHDAPGTTNPSMPSSSTNPNIYCGTAGSTTGACGDITVFSVNSATGRLTLVTNAQLTSSSGSQVTYFPVPADPIDFTLSGSYVFTLAGAPSAGPSTIVTQNGQTAFPYNLNLSSGELSIVTSTPQVLNIAGGTEMGQGVAIVNSSGHVYILDNDVDPTTNVPGQILSFSAGANGQSVSDRWRNGSRRPY